MRRVLAIAGLISLAGGLVLLPAASRSVAQVSAPGMVSALRGSSKTVKGPHMYNPATGKPFPFASTVTVSQTANLVNQLVQVSWAGFTPSQPSDAIFYSADSSFYSVMVGECRGTNPKRWSDCNEINNLGNPVTTGSTGTVSTTYAITTGKGTGQVPFDVLTSQENKPLGCDQNHPCSLAVIPGQGGTPADCADHSQDVTGPSSGFALALSTFSFQQSGSGPCSWRDRIVIPLRFAPVPTGCPLRTTAFSIAGSPMMAYAMQHWLTGLCAGKNGLTISYNSQDGEQLAVSQAVSETADVALTTRPASAQGVSTGGRRYVYAPVAASAVSLAYWIDDTKTGQQLSGLKMNQRLLAKLLTTSYDAALPDKGVQGNPWNIFTDPEFAGLDKAIDKRVNRDILTSGQQFEIPTVPSGPSDVTWTVTRWIGADPTAHAFLRGKRAPGGMRVNTYYRGLKYPTDAFTPQDPTAYYSRLYNPVFPFSRVVRFQALNQDAGAAHKTCNASGICSYTQDPPEPVGARDLFAIVDQGDAALNGFPVAAIANAAGRYVTPTNASMSAALHHMTRAGSGTLQVNLASKDPNAYPLTMVIYAMVPTSGLCHAKATAVARFLDFAAGTGQTPGAGPGQLPAGYLPLTASLRAQTRKAATEVSNEGCTSSGNPPSGSGSPTPTATSPSVGGIPSPGGGASPQPSVSLPAANALGSVRLVAATHPQTASITRYILPALLILGGLAALGGSWALAGSEGVTARLRRGTKSATAWGRYLRGDFGWRWRRRP